MTFREFMISKLEALDPSPKKEETKTMVTYLLPRQYAQGYFSIRIPKPGTRGYKKQMIRAMECFAIHFTTWGHSIAQTLAEFVLEQEKK
ncbi:MAG: hypothetical protein ACI4UF_03445 [Thermoguttaceae bacterium]